MIDELLNEIAELKEYKTRYESQKKDKERMSEELYKLMKEKYDSTPVNERIEYYKKDMCRCCRNGVFGDCTIDIPDNIREPIPSDKAWIPATRTCGHFEWD